MESCKHKNPGNLDGNTPLHMAALNGHLDICEAILENIDEKNPRNHFGGTPFHSAAARGHTVICQLFIEKKMPTDSSGETPLHLAANNGHLGIQFNTDFFFGYFAIFLLKVGVSEYIS